MLPPLPSGGLIEFFVSTATTFKFFIDPASLSVGTDGVVRSSTVIALATQVSHRVLPLLRSAADA